METKTKAYVEYDSNNSGGDWWLKDEDWYALEKRGWKIAWKSLENLFDDKGGCVLDEDGTPKLVPIGQGNSKYPSLSRMLDKSKDGKARWLGALATKAYVPNCDDEEDAMATFVQVTGQDPDEQGCNCCGNPHSFYVYNKEKN